MRRGFTLIELLAVIVILAIISLITIPQLAKVVDNAKMNAGARSVEGHIESVNTEMAKLLLKGNDVSDGEISNISSLGINTKGNVTCSSYTIKGNSVVSASTCVSNGYTYSYNIENGAYILSGSKGSKANIFASANGRLHVEGSRLLNSKNQDFRLMGASSAVAPYSSYATYVSTHDKIYSKKALSNLPKWGANGFRVFIGKSFWDSTSEEYSKRLVDLENLIDTLEELDMYVVVNWSPSNDASNNPPKTEAAKKFFEDLSSHYKNDYHIIYEIWNEPMSGKTWQDIKNHANQVIPIIRNNAPDSLILVGTPGYDSRVDQVINDQLPYKNIMYTHHMYAEHVTPANLTYLKKAIDAGLPIFETETSAVSTSIATGDYVMPSHAHVLYKILAEHNISYMFFCWDSGPWAYNFVNIKKYAYDESLPDSILRQNALYFKKLLKGDYSTNSYLLDFNNVDTKSEGATYRSSEWKDKITSIEFKTRISIPKNAVKTWDLSIAKDNSVVGYLLSTNESDRYKMIIAANGKIMAPSDSRYLFANMKNLKSIDFTNFEMWHTQNIGGMFMEDSSLESLDLSGINSENIQRMWNTFYNCTSLKSINFEGWHPTILDWGATFYNCQSLVELDLSEFNVKKSGAYPTLFYNNKSLKRLNISTWEPDSISSLNRFIANASSLEEVDMSKMSNIKDDASLEYALHGVKAGAKIIVKDQSVIDKLKPTANTELNFEIKK